MYEDIIFIKTFNLIFRYAEFKFSSAVIHNPKNHLNKNQNI